MLKLPIYLKNLKNHFSLISIIKRYKGLLFRYGQIFRYTFIIKSCMLKGSELPISNPDLKPGISKPKGEKECRMSKGISLLKKNLDY